MKRVIFDFEFVPGNPCLPISVGMVNIDTGTKLYLEWPNAATLARTNHWLAENVAPYLSNYMAVRSEEEIEQEIRRFLAVENRDDLVLYADFGAYDFFLLSETLGGFSRSGLPYTYRELAHMNLPDEPVLVGEQEHNALDDVMRLARAFRQKEAATPLPPLYSLSKDGTVRIVPEGQPL